MADLGDYPRVLGLAPVVSAALDARGNDIPARLDLGWIWLESAGHVGEADNSVTSLGGELGLAQLSADERRATGFTDTGRMTGSSDDDARYQIDAMHALIDYYGGYVGALGAPVGSEIYWKLIKAAHGGGRGFMQSLAKAYMQDTGVALDDWGAFEAWALEHPYNGNASYTEHHLTNADKVWSNGLALAVAGNLVPSVAGGADSVGGWIPVVAALALLGAALYAVKG